MAFEQRFQYDSVIGARDDDALLTVAPEVERELQRAMRIVTRTPGYELPPDYLDGDTYSKTQPTVMQQLAAEQLFGRLSAPPEGKGVAIDSSQNIKVTPYTHELLVRELFATVARPNGVVYAVGGFNPDMHNHARQYPAEANAEQRLRIVSPSAARAETSIAPDLAAMEHELQRYRENGELCAILYTQPNQAAVEDDTSEEQAEIARIFAEQDVPILCDMTYDALASDYTPLATLEVTKKSGQRIHMFDKTVSFSSNLQGYNAPGPAAFAAVCSGDTEFLKRLRSERLTIAFQRETTLFARQTLEHTSSEYLQRNRRFVRAQQMRMRRLMAGQSNIQAIGKPEGLHTTLLFNPELLANGGVATSRQLAYRALVETGIDAVPTESIGILQPGLRVASVAPLHIGEHFSENKRDAVQEELVQRLLYLVHDLGR